MILWVRGQGWSQLGGSSPGLCGHLHTAAGSYTSTGLDGLGWPHTHVWQWCHL